MFFFTFLITAKQHKIFLKIQLFYNPRPIMGTVGFADSAKYRY